MTTRPRQLTAREAAVLDLEGAWWQSADSKEQLVAERFGWSTARYYQELDVLVDDPAALVHDPLVVHRVRRLRDVRRSQRAARRLRLEVDA